MMFAFGILIGAAATVTGLLVMNRLMFSHPDEALCTTCEKTYNTVYRDAACPHRKKCAHRWGKTRGEGCSPIEDVRYCEMCNERQVVGSNA